MPKLTLLSCLLAGCFFVHAAQGRQAVSAEEADTQRAAQEGEARYGVGLRVRGLFVPRRVFERFVEVAPSGIAQPGIGLEGIRRKGNFEVSLGLAWAGLSAKDGVWLDDPDHNPSLVEFDALSWVSLDVTGVWKHWFNQNIALRYGMGVGVGILMGDVLETDYTCAGTRYDLRSCRQHPAARDVRAPIDLPPVVPVANALLGLQYAPSEQVAFNLDAGLHTALFVGLSIDIFFE